jgi:hypothetical protein
LIRNLCPSSILTDKNHTWTNLENVVVKKLSDGFFLFASLMNLGHLIGRRVTYSAILFEEAIIALMIG